MSRVSYMIRRRVKNGCIVTWVEVGRSMHNYGYAVDVVDKFRGYYIDWNRLSVIGDFCGFS